MTDQPPRTSRPFLSVAIITLNEADRIPRLLASVVAADEIVVVDSGSSDDTVNLCDAAGARVIHHPWTGYPAQKQFAMENCRGEWILNLDADEIVSEESAQEILNAVKAAELDVNGFSMPRLSRYLDRWIRHGGWYPDRKVRLVRRGRAHWVGHGLHEKLQVSGTTSELKFPLLHYVYRDISDQLKTIDRFSAVAVENRTGPASAAYVVWGLFHAFGKFLECAVWKLGVLDGIPGLIIAANSAFYVFLRHAKAWEKGLPGNQSPPDS
jgi:glycosyltransferase involved in cell wall biosynthesis